MRRLKPSTKICAVCYKGTTIGMNRPHSLHRTKRLVQPNLQTFIDASSGISLLVCTRCKRTLSK